MSWRGWWHCPVCKPSPARSRKAREAKVAEVRKEAFGEVNERTRAEDRQRLTEAAANKGSLI